MSKKTAKTSEFNEASKEFKKERKELDKRLKSLKEGYKKKKRTLQKKYKGINRDKRQSEQMKQQLENAGEDRLQKLKDEMRERFSGGNFEETRAEADESGKMTGSQQQRKD